MSSPIPSTPANPAEIARQIGPLGFRLTAEGLTIRGLPRGPVTLTVEESLCVSDFLRGPGARTLITRSWLAAQYQIARDRAAIDAAEALAD